jgi:soluble lytic murein transglycosylase-like protein
MAGSCRKISRILAWKGRIASLAILACLLSVHPAAALEVQARPADLETAQLLRAPEEPALQNLPDVLSGQDARLYREIFSLQVSGKWKQADERIAKLSDQRLMGHVLAQRYLHPTAYRSKYKELRRWLAKYNDHPEAQKIYDLAIKRRPANSLWPKKPVKMRTAAVAPVPPDSQEYKTTKRLSHKQDRERRKLKRRFRRWVNRTYLSKTEKILTEARTIKLMDQVERDMVKVDLAAAWYYYGEDKKAYDLAVEAGESSGDMVPLADWTAGLAAWRMGELYKAIQHFERLANSERVSPWNSSAGAFWAARCHTRLQNPERTSFWLIKAARSAQTFYGLLARRVLGLRTRFDFRAHPLTVQKVTLLQANPLSARALGLLQVGQRDRAESELRRLMGSADPAMTEALLAVTNIARFPALALKFGKRLSWFEDPLDDSGRLDVALYPIPPWTPKGGFDADRALLYAFMRQESGFSPRAKSPDGARGLMQLMPRTASFVARDRAFRRSKRKLLFQPEINMDLGQRYLRQLLRSSRIGDDLFRLTTAYNAGPGNLRRWEREMDFQSDPLLFIESLPSKETRLFIERVLANLWIYRARLRQASPSLDSLATGSWPLYQSLDRPDSELASNEPN